MPVCVDSSPFAQEFRLSLARITEENKHCLYYSNEYALENKLYNFPLTPTHKMPRVAQGNLWHLTLLAPNAAVRPCCTAPDLHLWNLGYISHCVVCSCSSSWRLLNTMKSDFRGILGLLDQSCTVGAHCCKDWYKDTSVAVQMLFCPRTGSLLHAPVHSHWKPAPLTQKIVLGAT